MQCVCVYMLKERIILPNVVIQTDEQTNTRTDTRFSREGGREADADAATAGVGAAAADRAGEERKLQV